MGVADSVHMILRPKDLQKASDLFGIELSTLERLNAQCLLNAEYIRNVIIRADYERLTSGLHWLEHQDKTYTFPEVQRALSIEYNIGVKQLRSILHGRGEKLSFCVNCGTRITKKCRERTAGLCSNCFAETLGL